jgi:transposase
MMRNGRCCFCAEPRSALNKKQAAAGKTEIFRNLKVFLGSEVNRFDAMTTWDFLRLLHSRSLKSRRRVVVIIDNAKYHHAKLHCAWRQEHEPQFHLDYLPPYSPDLNPIERV